MAHPRAVRAKGVRGRGRKHVHRQGPRGHSGGVRHGVRECLPGGRLGRSKDGDCPASAAANRV